MNSIQLSVGDALCVVCFCVLGGEWRLLWGSLPKSPQRALEFGFIHHTVFSCVFIKQIDQSQQNGLYRILIVNKLIYCHERYHIYTVCPKVSRHLSN